MKRFLGMGILAVVGLSAAAYAADDFWVKKDWKEWSAGECKKMLEDSPWAKRILVENENNVGHLPSVSRTATETDTVQGAQNSGVGEISYFFQFRSVGLVRKAYVRQQQIDQKYDTMNDAQKKAFDNKMAEALKDPSDDIILLHVIYRSNKPGLQVRLDDAWKTLEPGKVPKDFFLLTDKGVHVLASSLAFTEGADNEFDATFPRVYNGEPIFGPGAKSIKLQMNSPALGDFGAKKVNAEFKLDRMMLDGKLAY